MPLNHWFKGLKIQEKLKFCKRYCQELQHFPLIDEISRSNPFIFSILEMKRSWRIGRGTSDDSGHGPPLDGAVDDSALLNVLKPHR